MYCGRQTNGRMNYIHEQTLRAVCNEKASRFKELPGKDKTETIHLRNIKILAPELFKT